MRLILSISLLLLLSSQIRAQGQSYNQEQAFLNANKVWAFSHNAGLDFNSGTAVPIQTVIPSAPWNRQGEGTSAVSDLQTGALLFYTDGAQCWNAIGQLMPNGDSLLGNGGSYWGGGDPLFIPFATSTKQGSCIIPVPGYQGKYYLFSLNYQGNIAPSGSLFYNVVDMSLANGMGDIVPGQKNILLDSTSLSEAMIAVPGNNCDVWLIVHSSYKPNNQEYRAYHITGNGVNPDPVISYGLINNWVGSMSVSPDRKRIALAGFYANIAFEEDIIMGGNEVVKFDPNTGLMSDAIEIGTDTGGSQGCAFSPDNNKLYFDNFSAASGTTLIQYDISLFDSLSIDTSRKIVSPISTALGASFRLYNDTIYVAGFGTNSLSTINHPNNTGAACAYQSGTISLLSGTSSAMACLPSEVVIPGSPDTNHAVLLDTLICSSWFSGFTLNPAEVHADYAYEWQDQSMETTLTVNQPGAYWVRYSNGCHTFIDSFVLSGTELTPPVITVDVFELSTTVSYAGYQWMYGGVVLPGEDNATLTVSENGDYQVIVSNEAGCIDTSEIYTVTNANSINTMHPLVSRVTVYPNPTKDLVNIQSPVPVALQLMSIEGRLLQSFKKERRISLASFPAGIYFLRVTDMESSLIKTVKLVKTP